MRHYASRSYTVLAVVVAAFDSASIGAANFAASAVVNFAVSGFLRSFKTRERSRLA